MTTNRRELHSVEIRGHTRRLSSCYFVGYIRSPQSPTTRRLMGPESLKDSLGSRRVAT